MTLERYYSMYERDNTLAKLAMAPGSYRLLVIGHYGGALSGTWLTRHEATSTLRQWRHAATYNPTDFHISRWVNREDYD
jgi:hypothetical protein